MKQEELDEMLKEAPGPINFTVFLTMFGEKLKGDAFAFSPSLRYVDVWLLPLTALPPQVPTQRRPS